jgi:hypothetical protein
MLDAMRVPVLLLAVSALLVQGVFAANPTVAGRLHVEPSTFENLGFEWPIEGDANRDATVKVWYREAGQTAWKAALPLLRIGGERIYRDREWLSYIVPEGFAGSVLNVKPDTAYEVRFLMEDPDGVSGEPAERVVSVRTRRVPQPARCMSIPPIGPAPSKSPPSRDCSRPTTARAWAIGTSSGNAVPNLATRS